MTQPELKPCPFCGCEAEVLYNFVGCKGCLVILPDGYGYGGEGLPFPTEDEAIAAWNTRAVDPAAIREAALREALKVMGEWTYCADAEEEILALIGEKK